MKKNQKVNLKDESKSDMIKNESKSNKIENKLKSEKIISCPKCSNYFSKIKMRKIMHPSGAILDVCDKCGGMWIDSPEVDLLQNFKEPIKSKINKKTLEDTK